MANLQARLQAAVGDAYRIERELGGGGMSRLFLATEASLHRQVVIKLLPPELASEVSAARFQQEIEFAAHLQHPNILPVLAAGARDNLLFYVMPFVSGESLRHRLTREGKLPVGDAVRILREVVDALAYAHAEGVIHRYIKPENILLAGSHAMLADFGVARALGEARSGDRLTDTGVALGTPAYMSPEQAAGERHIDARADVYALAVVGYEMLAGFPPFTGPTVQSLMAAHLTERPKPLADFRPEAPPQVIDAIMRALTKDASARLRTAAEFREALDVDLGRPVPTHRRWLVPAVGLGVVGLGVAALLLRGAGTQLDGPGAPNSLAVLYFDNLSRDSADAYIVDGLTEDIIVRLGQVQELDVKSRYASQRFKGGATRDPAEIGGALGAAYLLSGSVRPAGGRLRVTAELVHASSGARVWGNVFDRSSSELLAVPEQIGHAVATAITGELRPQDRAELAHWPTRDPVAYDLYLRARFVANRYTEPDLRAAIALYEQAFARDSSFALAQVAIGDTWTWLADEWLPPREAYSQAQRAAQRALAIDSSAAALGLLVWPTLVLDYDLATAERAARGALELDPGHEDASMGMSSVRLAQGRMGEAIDYARRGWEGDSLSFFGALSYVMELGGTQRYDELAAVLPRLRATAPKPEVRGWEGLVRLGRGDCDGAVVLLREGHHGLTRLHVVPALVCAGRRAEARHLVDSLIAVRRSRYLPGTLLAVGHAALGDLDRAFEWMDRAYEERDFYLTFWSSQQLFGPMRSDPRFDALLRRTWLASRPKP